MSKKNRQYAKKNEENGENPVSLKPKTNFSPSTDSPVNQVLHLQKTRGNQAVQELMESGKLRAKLTIGKPNDKYEQEADRVADQVMRMPEGSLGRKEDELVKTKPVSNRINPLVQRQVEPEDEEMVQPKNEPGQSAEVNRDIEFRIDAPRVIFLSPGLVLI